MAQMNAMQPAQKTELATSLQDILEKAEQKVLRLHLYLPNYPFEKLEMELQRIQQRR